MNPNIHALIVDDEDDHLETLCVLLEARGMRVSLAHNRDEALARCGEDGDRISLLLMDWRLPGTNGFALTKEIVDQERWQHIVPILITAHSGDAHASRAMRDGFDMGRVFAGLLYKPLTELALVEALRTATPEIKRRADARMLRQAGEKRLLLSSLDFYSESPVMRKAVARARRVALTSGLVHLSGETGTGKSQMAIFIHESSKRAQYELSRIDCGDVTDTLFGNELFGHEKGAFTGATERTTGVAGAAEHGTLFLDELGKLEPRNQTRLLTLLKEKQVRLQGGTRYIKATFRTIVAASENLQAMVEKGQFSNELYQRILAGTTITLPPLRERREDIPGLALAIFERLRSDASISPNIVSISQGAIVRLCSPALTWPGNLNSLEAVLLAASLSSSLKETTLSEAHIEDALSELPRLSETAKRGGVTAVLAADVPEEIQASQNLRRILGSLLVQERLLGSKVSATERAKSLVRATSKAVGPAVSNFYRSREVGRVFEILGKDLAETMLSRNIVDLVTRRWKLVLNFGYPGWMVDKIAPDKRGERHTEQ